MNSNIPSTVHDTPAFSYSIVTLKGVINTPFLAPSPARVLSRKWWGKVDCEEKNKIDTEAQMLAIMIGLRY